jgi:hypothetical protein
MKNDLSQLSDSIHSSFGVHNRTFTSMQGRVHSLLPSKLRSHSRPMPVHSSCRYPAAGNDPFARNLRFASSRAAPAKAVVVEFTISMMNSATLVPEESTTPVAAEDEFAGIVYV